MTEAKHNLLVTAHPRRCGDHIVPDGPVCRTVGSSPQVRGPLRAVKTIRLINRLIPAGAGTTVANVGGATVEGAHPRGCGDHIPTAHTCRQRRGSSPQVRGPRLGQVFAILFPRLIPAGAGTTTLPGFFPFFRWAHPRRCGDHKTLKRARKASVGSSPQVRGPLHARPLPRRGLRLIPAGAGTTQSHG